MRHSSAAGSRGASGMTDCLAARALSPRESCSSFFSLFLSPRSLSASTAAVCYCTFRVARWALLATPCLQDLRRRAFVQSSRVRRRASIPRSTRVSRSRRRTQSTNLLPARAQVWRLLAAPAFGLVQQQADCSVHYCCFTFSFPCSRSMYMCVESAFGYFHSRVDFLFGRWSGGSQPHPNSHWWGGQPRTWGSGNWGSNGGWYGGPHHRPTTCRLLALRRAPAPGIHTPPLVHTSVARQLAHCISVHRPVAILKSMSFATFMQAMLVRVVVDKSSLLPLNMNRYTR